MYRVFYPKMSKEGLSVRQDSRLSVNLHLNLELRRSLHSKRKLHCSLNLVNRSNQFALRSTRTRKSQSACKLIRSKLRVTTKRRILRIVKMRG